jgi:hypothetical protein
VPAGGGSRSTRTGASSASRPVDADTDADAGVLAIVKGNVDKTFTSMKLKGTVEGANGPIVVKLKGVRPPDAFPCCPTARPTAASRGVKSKA